MSNNNINYSDIWQEKNKKLTPKEYLLQIKLIEEELNEIENEIIQEIKRHTLTKEIKNE